MTWVRYKPKARMRVLDRIFPEGIHIPDYFFGKNIVHLPTTKCHIYTTTTGAMKNAFGGLLNTRRHYTHSWIHETLVDLLAIQKEIHSGLFAIMDGTTAGNGPGPRTMFPVVKNVMLASADQVAIDAVSAKMMGFDPMSLDYIRLAHEDGLGVGDPRDIEIVGDVDAAKENWDFHVGKNLVRVGGGDLIWFGPLKRFQKLFFHTPLVNGFILASDVYHDFYRWPLRRPPRVRALVRDDRVGPDVPALRADGPAGPAARAAPAARDTDRSRSPPESTETRPAYHRRRITPDVREGVRHELRSPRRSPRSPPPSWTASTGSSSTAIC